MAAVTNVYAYRGIMTSTCRLNSFSLLAELVLLQKWRWLAKTNPGAHLDVGEALGASRIAVHDDAHILHLRASVELSLQLQKS